MSKEEILKRIKNGETIVLKKYDIVIEVHKNLNKEYTFFNHFNNYKLTVSYPQYVNMIEFFIKDNYLTEIGV